MEKKAQMEILGLAIVVILLILGMVFVIKFIALGDKGSIRKEVSESQIASNYISTYLDTTIGDCRKLSIEELLIDCAEGNSIICSQGPPVVKSCKQANETAKLIFENTFQRWRQKYQFTVFLTGTAPLISNGTLPGNTCPGVKRSKDYFLSTAQGTLHVKLDLC